MTPSLLSRGEFVYLLAAAAVPSSPGTSRIHVCTELFEHGATHPPVVKGALTMACRWNQRTISVRFLEGDPVVKDRVRQVASQWNDFAGVKLVFNDAPDADIRISFDPNGGSWSFVGICRGDRPATMNFGWLTPTTSDFEYHRVVLHEFGHALGLIHEHQSPGSPIQWNLPAVYDYYWRTQHWDQAQVNSQIVNKYNAGETIYTTFDPSSIMVYAIPRELTTNGYAVPWNSQLSATDRAFIRQQYP